MTIRSTSNLYKYMSADRAAKFLEKLTIRFSQPSALNDPFECHLTLDRKSRSQLVEDFYQSMKEGGLYSEEQTLRERAAANEPVLVQVALKTYRDLRSSLGVLSVTECPLNLLMWAHYGDEHRGVVVELNYTHPSLLLYKSGDNEFAGLFAVDYTDRKVSGTPTTENVLGTLLTKSTDWKYEREWRFVRTLNLLREFEDGVFVSDLDPQAVKRVILGARISREKIDKIAKLLSDPRFSHVIVEQAMLIPNRFGLKLVPAKDYGWVLLHREHHYGEVADEALQCVPMVSDEEDGEIVGLSA